MSDNMDPKQLREVAEAATPGPWEAHHPHGMSWIAADQPSSSAFPTGCTLMIGKGMDGLDATHIATFDPPTVLALLSRLEQAKAELANWKTTAISRGERAEQAEQQVARVREALSNHPRTCDQHTEDDPVKCGWKRAVIDVQNALDGEQDG